MPAHTSIALHTFVVCTILGALVWASVAMGANGAIVVSLVTATWTIEHLHESSGQFPLAHASAHHLESKGKVQTCIYCNMY